MLMEERFEFCFCTVTGFHVKLDFLEHRATVENKALNYKLTTDFSRIRVGDGTINVLGEFRDIDVLHLCYGVEQRYIDQIQRFL